MKYIKYLIINILIILFFSLLSYKIYVNYLEILNENKSLNLEYSKLERKLNEKINSKKEYHNVKNEDEYIIYKLENKDDFLKSIYYFLKEADIELLDISNEIIKDKNKNYELVYKVFKVKGTLIDFFEFLSYVYSSNIYLDSEHMHISINENDIQFSLGYLRSRLN